ncbi:hypothetical protein ACSBR1_027587 [Camellia fascicularis]
MWNLAFRRELYDWEEDQLQNLLNQLAAGPVLRPNQVDRPVWSASNSGQFSIASLYKLVVGNLGPTLSVNKLVWLKFIPPKVQVFGWMAWKKRIKTKEFLQRLGILTVNGSNLCNLCVFCKSEFESVNHVLVCCPFVWSVWSHMLNWWGTQGALPGTVDQLLLCLEA